MRTLDLPEGFKLPEGCGPVERNLRLARALISEASRWTQGCAAEDETGTSVPSDDESAVCWCSLGALHLVNYLYGDVEKATAMLKNAMDGYIWTYNDFHTHEEVMAKWDVAIARAAAQGV